MSFNQLFKEELINFDLNVTNKTEFFSTISEKLLLNNFVKPSFEQAILVREENYPTGLALENFAVAIPHTDVVHIVEPFVSVNRLQQEIDFIQMGTDDVIVPVKDILVLGIKEPHKQVGLLQELMNCFANQEFVENYKKAASKNELVDLIKNYL